MVLDAKNIAGLISSVNSSISDVGVLRRPTVSDVDGLYDLTEAQKKLGIDVVYPKEFLREVTSDKDAINYVISNKDNSALLSMILGYPSVRHPVYRAMLPWEMCDDKNLKELNNPKGFHIALKATSPAYSNNGLYKIVKTIQKADAFARGLNDFYLEAITQAFDIHKHEGFEVIRPILIKEPNGDTSTEYFMGLRVTPEIVDKSISCLETHLKKYCK
jgi:hypothetical protein